MEERRKKNLLITILCIVVILMGVGYAILASNLTIQGQATLSGNTNWNVKITNVVATTYGGGKDCTTDEPCANGIATSYTGTNATLSSELSKPGDYVEYTITVSNSGSIDATLKSIMPYVSDNFYVSTYEYAEDNVFAIYNGPNTTITIGDITYIYDNDNEFFTESSLDLPKKVDDTPSTKSFKVKFEYNNSSTSIATGENSKLSFSLNYVQAD